MRQVREVLRLKAVGNLPNREIARRLGVAPSTVRETLKRFTAAGLTWPLVVSGCPNLRINGGSKRRAA